MSRIKMTNAFFYNLVSCNTVTSGYNILFNNTIRGCWNKKTNSTALQTKFNIISTQLNTFRMLPSSLRYKKQRKQFYRRIYICTCFNALNVSYIFWIIYTLSHRLYLKLHKTARLDDDDGTYKNKEKIKKTQKFHFSIWKLLQEITQLER